MFVTFGTITYACLDTCGVASLRHRQVQGCVKTKLNCFEIKPAGGEVEISIEKCKTIICLNEVQIKSFYEKALRLDAQMLIGTLIKEIIVFNDKIEIYLNSPITTSPDMSQGFLFYKEKDNQSRTKFEYGCHWWRCGELSMRICLASQFNKLRCYAPWQMAMSTAQSHIK